MKSTKVIMDGNEVAAHIAYEFTEVAGIYPITPSSPMAEKTDEWAALGRKNMFGQTVRLVEMQSEAGAVGAVHGALEAGALATSYTSSQGLMLMIPTMHRISGQRHPGVLHVAARTVGTHAFSIFGDHSDVMNCRQTGFAMLSAGSVQEVADLAAIAHLSAIKGSIPFLHFFDGFRTSHEIQKIDVMTSEDLKGLVDLEALERFRARAINPEDPVMRSTVQNPDIYFQVRETSNKDYAQLPQIVEEYMGKVEEISGRKYELFSYYGDPQATNVVVAMGSVSGTIQEVVRERCKRGEKVGFVQVRLYRPFSREHLLEAVPATCKVLSVLDRVKEGGSVGEPLFEDVCTCFINQKNSPKIIGGRYVLSSKDTTPAHISSVFANMEAVDGEVKEEFTIGIKDDVTFLSLEEDGEIKIDNQGTICCKFWGLGSDGTVGANKNSIKIIGNQTEMNCQAYFEYDTKKSFGITKSHLRFGNKPILSTYLVKEADFVACHNQGFLTKYDIVSELKTGGTFLLNCSYSKEEIEEKLPFHVKKTLAEKKARLFIVDGASLGVELGLGNHTNIILQAAFFQLSKVIPTEDAREHMKAEVIKTYGKKGEKIVEKNLKAVDVGMLAPVEVKIPKSWLVAMEQEENLEAKGKRVLKEEVVLEAPLEIDGVIEKILVPINKQKGDDIPVSTFMNMKDGTMPLGTSAYEKRGLSRSVPIWHGEECLQCNMCAFVCPHGVIRPQLPTDKEAEGAPSDARIVKAKGKGLEGLNYMINVSVLDCTGCGSCVANCPRGGKALTMGTPEDDRGHLERWNWGLGIADKSHLVDGFTTKGSQFRTALLEFSGACAGCGETPYIKLLTQLYGDRMYFANGTGCTQAWGAAMPCMPYTKNQKGRGPAWSNSLFENNAEFSYGMCLAVKQQREAVKKDVEGLLNTLSEEAEAMSKEDWYQKSIDAIKKWQSTYEDLDASMGASEELISILELIDSEIKGTNKSKPKKEMVDLIGKILSKKNHLSKKTMWMVGGDGWTYDIGYGGLDHVFAMGEDVNVLVVDTEVYSNTGGQSSKATPIGAVAQFQASGKKSQKKDLGRLMMSYDNVYVAQVAMGANPNQLMRAMKEAVDHRGPSIVIAYAPCIAHGITRGMDQTQQEMKAAVESGYWPLYRWNPDTRKFIMDSKEPTGQLVEFLRGEVRYASLERSFPENAKELFEQASKAAMEKDQYLRGLADRNK